MIQSEIIKPIGLKMDNLPVEQPRDSVRFALNGSLEGEDGIMNYQAELGNEPVAQLKAGYQAIGHINLDNNEVALFSTNGASSEIGLFNKGSYQELINTPCLGFSTCSPITGEFRILAGCDRILYWCDGLNEDRRLNIDDLEAYQDNLGGWDCNLLKLNPDFLVPYISDISVNSTGGTLDSGSYSFTIEILDDNLKTIVTGLSTPYIPVYVDNQGSNYQSINGNFPLFLVLLKEALKLLNLLSLR